MPLQTRSSGHGRWRFCALAALLLVLPDQAARASLLDLWGDGHSTVQLGVAHLDTFSSSSSLSNRLRPSLAGSALGIPENFDSPGAGTRPIAKQTIAISVSRALAPRWTLEADAGIPPVVKVRGEGMVFVPTLAGPLFAMDLSDPAINPLGAARQWSPALLLKYRLLANCRALCPFVGLGTGFSWFTSTHLSPSFDAQLNAQYGASLALGAGKPGPTSTQVRVRPGFSPVFGGGITSALGDGWSLSLASAYVPFSTVATVRILAADGTTLATTTGRIRANASVSALSLGFSW